MNGIQLLGLLFALFMLYSTWTQYQKRSIPAEEAGFWGVFWVIFGFLSVMPGVLSGVASNLQIASVFDLLVVGGFLILLAVVFWLYTEMRATQAKLNRLVREMAKR